MTSKLLTSAAIACAMLGVSAAAIAQSSTPPAVEARQGLMRLQSLHLGVLAGMARGTIEYDAEQATLAANNLLDTATLDQSFMWPEGTDNMMVVETRALPAIWDDQAGYQEDRQDLIAAAEQMVAVAGDGVDAVRGAIGAVGGTCGACHDAYRADN